MAAASWAAGAAALLSACAGKPAPTSRPVSVVRPAAPPPEAQRPAEPPDEDWRDGPLSLGDWSYTGGAGGSEAGFAGFSLRCDPGRRQIMLSREGAGGPLRIRTSYGHRILPPGAALPAADALLDEMAYSRGRFTVEADGLETLIMPAWPEPARVIEDCRG